MKWMVSAPAFLLEILRKRLTDRHLEAKLAKQLQQLPLPYIMLSHVPFWKFPRNLRSGLCSCQCQSSELALFCPKQGSLSALPAVPVESFLLWVWTNLPGHSNISWSFFRSLTEFYWIAAVNFESNNGKVEFSNFIFLKVSLKSSVLISSNLSIF